MQQQQLVAKEQRLKYLKQQEYQHHQMASEYDRLRRSVSNFIVFYLQTSFARLLSLTREFIAKSSSDTKRIMLMGGHFLKWGRGGIARLRFS